jgi:sec-independent protein translocase protein TatB
VFGSLGWGEILVLCLLGLVIFGPDKLPQVIKDTRSTIRELLSLARNAKADLQAELGPEMADLDLASLHPRRIVQDFVFGEDDEDPIIGRRRRPGQGGAASRQPAAAAAGRLAPQPALAPGEAPPWDVDAT